MLPEIEGLVPRQPADAARVISNLRHPGFFVEKYRLHIPPAAFGGVDFMAEATQL